MKNGKFLFSVVLIGVSINLFLHKTSFSQEEGQVWYNVVSIPPSPNAAALGKYGEIPVDKSTGVPNISIPIFDISEGGIDVSISLNYHAGGIRVQDEATWVGLGWSLNAGGVITRAMRGLPDDNYYGFLKNAEKVPWAPIIDQELSTHVIADLTYEKLNSMAKGYLDYEPDVFYYNFVNVSGSFMFGNNKQPITIPFSDITIVPLFNESIISGFILTAPDGIIYIFGDTLQSTGYTEQTDVQWDGPDPGDYISSWYLQKIINPLTKASISFEYDTDFITSSVNYSATKMYEYDGFYEYVLQYSVTNQCQTDINDAKYLRKISFESDSIIFHSSISDDGGRKLDFLLFHAHKFEFNYDYFKVDSNSTGKNELRLKLLSIKETNPDIENDKEYSFEYSSPNLPAKNSNAIDYWGFYNGKTNNQNTIPPIIYGGKTYGDADRNPYWGYPCAGVLTKITYPTGGYSIFNYENNAYGRLPTPEEISRPGGSPYYNVTGIDIHEEKCETKSLNFNSNLNYTNFVLTAKLTKDSSYEGVPHGRVQLLDDANNILYEILLNDTEEVSYTLNDNALIDLIAMNVCASGSMVTTQARLTWDEYDPAELHIKREYLAGGLRIKQIMNYDHVSNKTIFKTFDYDTSGYLNTNLPSYYTNPTSKRIDPSNGQTRDYYRLMTYLLLPIF